MENNAQLIAQCTEKAQQWLTPAFDEATRKEVEALIASETRPISSNVSTRTLNLVPVDFVASWVQVAIV